MTTPTIDLGRFGVFTFNPGSSFLGLGLAVTPEQAQEIERLGYGTVWITGSPAAELAFAEPLLESTTALKVATGIVNIWTADAKTVAESFHRIDTAHPGRFVLGIGAGHPEHTGQYRKPYDALVWAWAFCGEGSRPVLVGSARFSNQSRTDQHKASRVCWRPVERRVDYGTGAR